MATSTANPPDTAGTNGASETSEMTLTERLQMQAEAPIRVVLEETQEAYEAHQAAQALLDRLGGPSPVAADPAPRRTSTPRRQPARRSSSDGPTRKEQLLRIVTERPGIKSADAAKEMGLNQPNYVYKVVKELEAEGGLRRDDDGGLYVADAPR